MGKGSESGRLVKRARGRRSKTAFARDLGVSRPLINQYEDGSVKPSIKVWLKMADLAGYPINRDIWEYIGFDRERITRMFQELRDKNDSTPQHLQALKFKKTLNELSKAEPVTEGLLNDPQPPEAYSKTVEEFWERNKTSSREGQAAVEVKPKSPKKKGKPRKKGKK